MKHECVNSALAFKLKGLGADSDDLDSLMQAVKRRVHLAAGADILREGESLDKSPVLLAGMAAAYKRTGDGQRRLHSFQHAGDFCHLYRYALPEHATAGGVEAATDVVVGVIDLADLDRLMARPSLALAFWRATMLEATLGRQRLAIANRGSALERVAHFLNEQVWRREAVGICDRHLPLSRMDIADAIGLSIDDVDRAIQSLRCRKILSNEKGAIEVFARKRLAQAANFDGRSIDMPRLLASWAVDLE